jgi:hypothetical protein
MRQVYRLFDPDQSPHQARCRRAVLVKAPEFLADADLAQALAMLTPDKCDKMIAYLHSPASQRVRTNNHIEHVNRRLRYYFERSATNGAGAGRSSVLSCWSSITGIVSMVNIEPNPRSSAKSDANHQHPETATNAKQPESCGLFPDSLMAHRSLPKVQESSLARRQLGPILHGNGVPGKMPTVPTGMNNFPTAFLILNPKFQRAGPPRFAFSKATRAGVQLGSSRRARRSQLWPVSR